MRDLPSITQFTKRVQSLNPPTQAGTHQSTPAGNFTIEYGVVEAVNNTASQVNNLLPYTCSVKIKGSVQLGIAWFDTPPIVGTQVILGVQPPLTYVLGTSSTTANNSWQTYTPTWTGSSSNPALGNGSIFGRWQMLGPKTCAVRMQLITGSSTSFGSGAYTFSLPFTASGTGSFPGTGAGILVNAAGVFPQTWLAEFGSAASVMYGPASATNGALINLGSGSFSAGSQYVLATMIYETV